MAPRRKREELDDAASISDADAALPPAKKAKPGETNAAAKRSLFVRSLPAKATTESLTELFSQNYPLKHATVVLDNSTKQCKGYGFVTFADAEDAQKALDEFNGQSFQGRKMRIELAQPRLRVKDSAGARQTEITMAAAADKAAREEKLAQERRPPKLIIRNLPWSIKTEEQLADLFRGYGKVKFSTLPKVKETQAGFGFITMRGRKNAEKAMAAINCREVGGRTLAVDWAVEKSVWESRVDTATSEEAVPVSSETATGPDGRKDTTVDKHGSSNSVEDDVANFMRNFGEGLESENDSDGTPDAEDAFSDADDASFESDPSSTDAFQDDISEGGISIEPSIAPKQLITDNSSTLFIRNLPFTTTDASLQEHFKAFGPVRYARVVMDHATDRSKGNGFVCFFNVQDAETCVRGAPRIEMAHAQGKAKYSVLQDTRSDSSGMYTIEGRVLHVTKAVDKSQAAKLTAEGADARNQRDRDKRKLFLLSEGTVAAGTPLYNMLAPSEIKMREDSVKQRKKLIQTNPSLHLSLTRLSIRNLPRNVTGSDLKALAREAVVGFATDVKAGKRAKLSKEEEGRGGPGVKEAERQRKAKGKGIVRQAKIVFEGREGGKVAEDSGAGRSRGYGFVEYSSHRWALMGLRWLNGHALTNSLGKKQRLIVEFAIENAQVVQRRQEREEKARTHSKDVVQKREAGELPPKQEKGKKKAGKPGKLDRSASRGKMAQAHRRGGGKKGDAQGADGESTGKTATSDDKLARRANIIQRKRMLRRNRKQGKT